MSERDVLANERLVHVGCASDLRVAFEAIDLPASAADAERLYETLSALTSEFILSGLRIRFTREVA